MTEEETVLADKEVLGEEDREKSLDPGPGTVEILLIKVEALS